MKKWGLKSKLLFLTLLPTIIIALLLSIYFSTSRIQDLEQALLDRGYAISLQMIPASEYGVFSGNSKLLQKLANDVLSEHPEVEAISIFNKEGSLLAHAGHETIPGKILSVQEQSHGIKVADTKNSLLFTVPVTTRDLIIEDYAYSDFPYEHSGNNNNVLGWISIELGRMSTTIRQYQVLFACSIILLIGMIITIIFAYRIAQEVTRPLLKMVDAVEKIKNGNLDTVLNTHATSELRQLESGINSMTTSLKVARDEMQDSIEQATADLQQTLEMIEIQNIELDMARKKAEQNTKLKSEFLATVSHEIRTPLNGVMGFINLLVKTQLDVRQMDYLSTIQKSAAHLLSIINDVLDFSKIEAGKFKLDYVEMDLYECVEDSLTLMAPLAHAKSLELAPMIYSDIPRIIIADQMRLQQIITNLVSNSIKFTEKGSVVVRVMLNLDLAEKLMIGISITDSGIGLTEKEKECLFQAFTQGENTSARRFGGTGLGLVISKRLVEQMGGQMEIESQINKGSTFLFTFLANRVIDAPPPYFDPRLTNFRVLIHEEHQTTLLTLNHLLTSWGMKVTEVQDPQKIPQILEDGIFYEQPFQIILLGINRPDPHCSFIQEINQLAKSKYHCQFGILANTSDHYFYDQIHKLGIELALAKPVGQRKLHNALLKILVEKTDTPPPLTTADTPENTRPQGALSVLVVDDYDLNVKLLKALLESFCSRIDVANNGVEAVEFSQKTKYDLIFMDIQMPQMDGITATKKIRALELPGQHIPIIALTAHAVASEKEAAIDAGMDEYLTKPINVKMLEAAIEKWQKVESTYNTKRLAKKLVAVKHPVFVPKVNTNNLEKAPSPVDWKMALDLSGSNRALARDMLAGLINCLNTAHPLINNAFEAEDFNLLREEVHRLHGACCYCGVPDLKNVLGHLETAIVDHNNKAMARWLKKYNIEVARLLKYIKIHSDIFAATT